MTIIPSFTLFWKVWKREGFTNLAWRYDPGLSLETVRLFLEEKTNENS
jgi:hypothetical protein